MGDGGKAVDVDSELPLETQESRLDADLIDWDKVEWKSRLDHLKTLVERGGILRDYPTPEHATVLFRRLGKLPGKRKRQIDRMVDSAVAEISQNLSVGSLAFSDNRDEMKGAAKFLRRLLRAFYRISEINKSPHFESMVELNTITFGCEIVADWCEDERPPVEEELGLLPLGAVRRWRAAGGYLLDIQGNIPAEIDANIIEDMKRAHERDKNFVMTLVFTHFSRLGFLYDPDGHAHAGCAADGIGATSEAKGIHPRDGGLGYGVRHLNQMVDKLNDPERTLMYRETKWPLDYIERRYKVRYHALHAVTDHDDGSLYFGLNKISQQDGQILPDQFEQAIADGTILSTRTLYESTAFQNVIQGALRMICAYYGKAEDGKIEKYTYKQYLHPRRDEKSKVTRRRGGETAAYMDFNYRTMILTAATDVIRNLAFGSDHVIPELAAQAGACFAEIGQKIDQSCGELPLEIKADLIELIWRNLIFMLSERTVERTDRVEDDLQRVVTSDYPPAENARQVKEAMRDFGHVAKYVLVGRGGAPLLMADYELRSLCMIVTRGPELLPHLAVAQKVTEQAQPQVFVFQMLTTDNPKDRRDAAATLRSEMQDFIAGMQSQYRIDLIPSIRRGNLVILGSLIDERSRKPLELVSM